MSRKLILGVMEVICWCGGLALFLLVVLALSLSAWADATAPYGARAATETTNRVVTSKTVTELAWKRNVVTIDELGRIHGDGGVVAREVETSAINDVAERAWEVSEAANEAMRLSLDLVESKTNDMANAGIGFAIAFRPETDDPNLRGFVVKTEYDKDTNKDIQWVHYNVELSLPPNRTVTYETHDKVENVKCDWGSWDAAGTNMVVSGLAWEGLHRCTVSRPTWAVGKSCLDLPNDTWGGENGMDWGSMTLVDGNGRAYFTGYVTNGITHEVAYFDNGFLKEIKSENE